MDLEFQQLRVLEEMQQIDEAVKYGLLTSNIRPAMEQDYFASSINNILVKLKYDHNLWFKAMIFRQGELASERGLLQTEAFKAKVDFKRIARPRTSDFGIDLVNRMSKNLEDNAVRKKLRIDITQNENESHGKNKTIWEHFLNDVKQGKKDSLVTATASGKRFRVRSRFFVVAAS